MSQSTSAEPAFQLKSSIFDVPSALLPTPPQSNHDTASSHDDISMEDPSPPLPSTSILAAITQTQPTQPKTVEGWMSPPPDLDEEPEGWADEMNLMREMEMQEEEEARAIRSSLPAGKGKAAAPVVPTQSQKSGSQAAFVLDEDIFEAPIASSSKTVWQPASTQIELDPSLPSFHSETAEGARVEFKRRHRPRPLEIETQHLGPLGQPLHKLLAEVAELKSLQKATRLQQEFDAASAPMNAGESSKVMWVDKYRPKKFADLLGEDRVHREVLGWLKEWDKCVFRRVVPGKKRRFDESQDNGAPVDPLGRPRERILLLSGPPGYGKTTLAQIVARQAGYRTLEINASDDRNAGTVSTRIKNAIDAGSGLGSEGRPTCVVIDEVDGASGGGDAVCPPLYCVSGICRLTIFRKGRVNAQSFIKSLIKLIQDVPARKKSNTPAKPLRRPIICICNDLYASSIRPLRQYARIIRFKKPQAQFLVKRLRDICDREKLSADMRVLGSLVELTSGDVRSCLNTLQFIKSKSSVLSDDAIKRSSLGQKDTSTTLHTGWNALFVPVSAKARRKVQAIDDGRYVDRIYGVVSSSGDVDRLVGGCFEHYPNLKPLDASLQNLTRLHDWLIYYDRLSQRISEEMAFELLPYQGYAVVPWYSHLAAPSNATKPVEWPKADYEAYQMRLTNEEVSTTLKASLPPQIRSLFSATATLTELIPLLMRIITPPLKPVNANIVKSDEKAVLSRLVELLIPLGLRFWMEKTETGQPMMRLEPPIDVFVHYEGKRADDIAASRFAVRQLIAQAMDKEMAKRRGGTDAEDLGSREALAGMYGVTKKAAKPVDTTKTEAIATDFFGRKLPARPPPDLGHRVSPDSLAPTAAALPPTKRFKAIYKFHEGSSSAVRKTIKMSALM